MIESDHGYTDPPAAIPLRVGWVEHLVAQQYGLDAQDVRCLAWKNLAAIIRKTGMLGLLPEPFATVAISVT